MKMTAEECRNKLNEFTFHVAIENMMRMYIFISVIS